MATTTTTSAAAPAAAPWRTLAFFERDNLVEAKRAPAPDGATLAAWLQSTQITCCSSGRGSVVFGDNHGIVHILNNAFVSACTFRAHSSMVTHLKQMRRKPVLLTIGEDESATPTLKIWNIDKEIIEKSRAPALIQSKKITHKAKVFPITALAVLENMTQIAIGLENGVVVVYRGDLSRARQAKTVLVHEGSETVTGLGFREDGAEVILYIVTLARILTCSTLTKDNRQTLEEQGTEIGLSLATPQDRLQEMAMARHEAVTFYGPDGRSLCFIIHGEKTLMTWFRGYVVIVSKETPMRTNVLSEFGHAGDTALSTDTADPSLARSWTSGHPTPGHVLTIYDFKSKFIAYRGSFGTRRFDASIGTAVGEPIVHVFSEWGDLFVMTKENKLFRLREMDLDSKLEVLYAKHLYHLAVSILSYPSLAIHAAKSRGETGGATTKTVAGAGGVLPTTSTPGNDHVSSTSGTTSNTEDVTSMTIMDIHRRHGDYLYTRGDYDASMKQYIKTIGSLEPSYVIRKFLDAQRIYNLTSYLQSLHDRRLGNANHTTLLLNCYTKLKDIYRLDSFIQHPDAVFDIDTAIRVCRQAGYVTHALKLAARFHQHEWHLHIQVDDLKQYDEAVAYLGVLPRMQVRMALRAYGHVLVKHRPKLATECLVRVCCLSRNESAAAGATAAATVVATTTANSAKPSSDTNSKPGPKVGLPASVAIPPPPPPPSSTLAVTTAPSPLSSSSSPPVLPPPPSPPTRPELANPEEFLSFFVNQPLWCIVFIETVLRKRWGVAKDVFTGSVSVSAVVDTDTVVVAREDVTDDADATSQQILWVTLLDLYLNQIRIEAEDRATVATTTTPASTHTDQPPVHRNWAKKIMSVLQYPQANYDADQALVLTKTNGFRDGMLYLYRRLGLYQDVLAFHMERCEYDLVLETCQVYGDREPVLWKRALVFFVECGTQDTSVATGHTAGSTTTSTSTSDTRNNLVTVLDEIERRKMLSQLEIIQLLSKNSAVTLGMVRDYLIRRIEADLESIDTSRQLITSYVTETTRMREHITVLEKGSMTFQSSTRCELCRLGLELPTVHFYCKHAYHQRCLGDDDRECPRCVPEQRMVQELVATQRNVAKRHDLFVQKLAEGSEHEDKFALIAEYFSKNVFAT